MISMRFDEFRAGNYDEAGIYHSLYVIRDQDEFYYVGISTGGIWWRWFDRYLGHFAKRTSIAERIIDNRPISNGWTIELWTQEDCRKFLEPDLMHFTKRQRKRMELKVLEVWMIRKLKPKDNTIFNARGYL